MTGNFLEACRVNWFHLTQRAGEEERRVQRKKSAQRREKSWRDTLCSGVDTTEGSNEGRKEGKKEGKMGRGQGDIVRESCLSERSVRSCENISSRADDETRAKKKRRRRAVKIADHVPRGYAHKGKTKQTVKTRRNLAGKCNKPTWRTSTWFPKRATRRRGGIWRRIKRREFDLSGRAGWELPLPARKVKACFWEHHRDRWQITKGWNIRAVSLLKRPITFVITETRIWNACNVIDDGKIKFQSGYYNY